MAPRDIVILGTGGTCIDVLDIVDELNAVDTRWNVIGFLDDAVDRHGASVAGYEVLGSLEHTRALPKGTMIANPLGSPTRPTLKRSIFERIGLGFERYATLVHPTASVSRRSTLGDGTILFQHVSVTAGATIGRMVTMLGGCRINHDDTIGDFATLANNVTVAGMVAVGEDAYVGMGSVIIGAADIGAGSIVGAGSTVIRPVDAGVVVAGNPARALRREA